MVIAKTIVQAAQSLLQRDVFMGDKKLGDFYWRTDSTGVLTPAKRLKILDWEVAIPSQVLELQESKIRQRTIYHVANALAMVLTGRSTGLYPDLYGTIEECFKFSKPLSIEAEKTLRDALDTEEFRRLPLPLKAALLVGAGGVPQAKTELESFLDFLAWTMDDFKHGSLPQNLPDFIKNAVDCSGLSPDSPQFKAIESKIDSLVRNVEVFTAEDLEEFKRFDFATFAWSIVTGMTAWRNLPDFVIFDKIAPDDPDFRQVKALGDQIYDLLEQFEPVRPRPNKTWESTWARAEWEDKTRSIWAKNLQTINQELADSELKQLLQEGFIDKAIWRFCSLVGETVVDFTRKKYKPYDDVNPPSAIKAVKQMKTLFYNG